MTTPETVLLDHGAGGRLAHDLTTNLMLPIFDNAMLADLNDGAILNLQGTRLAFSTDSFVKYRSFVSPIASCGEYPQILATA